jgi:hypothetical protein
LIVDPSFFKLNNKPGLRDRESISVHHRGGTTMRTWTRLIPAVLLVLPITPALLHAADPETPSLNDRLNQLSDKVKKLESDVTANSLRGNRVETELRAIKDELSSIRKLMERMAGQEPLRIQPGYDPRSINPAVPGGILPGAGTITVQNQYLAPATVRINDRPFRVEPNQSLPITGIPTGTFQYSVEVDGYGMIEPLRTDTLRPAGYRITIHPRMPYQGGWL